MKTFGTISPKDYTIDGFFASSPFQWRLASGSAGTLVTEPGELDLAVEILRGTSDRGQFLQDTRRGIEPPRNGNNDGVYEHVMYSSIRHLFYDQGVFYSGSRPQVESEAPLPDDIFVVSVGQDFYGERIAPGSFQLALDGVPGQVEDDGFGNLLVQGSPVGNIFYEHGIAVIAHNTAQMVPSMTQDGIKILGGTEVLISYDSQVKVIRHEINVRLRPSDFNFSWFNPSVRRTIAVPEQSADQIRELNIEEVGPNEWTIQSLIQAGFIKPYITTIGLYTDQNELVAVAKLSTPIQRIFESDQIFIVRFDT